MNLNKKYSFNDLFNADTYEKGGMYEEGGDLEKQRILKWYEENGYIRYPDINSIEGLIKAVKGSIDPAWQKFAKKYNLPESKVIIESKKDSYYIELDSKKIEGKDLGIFKNSYEYALLTFFSGRKINYSNSLGEFYFSKNIWVGLNLSMRYISGGSNGVNYMLDSNKPGEFGNTIVYDILEGKWYKGSEYKNNE